MFNLSTSVRQVEPWVAMAVVIFDQIAKAIVVHALPLHASLTILPGIVDLTHVQNTGAAFGMLNAVEFPFKSVVITTVAFGALIAIACYAGRFGSGTPLARVGLALIIGGAAGNLIDRARQGYVVDFVDVYWRDWHFWAFNVADAAITVGASALILDMLGVGRRHVSEAV
jgi:signal peptidase II